MIKVGEGGRVKCCKMNNKPISELHMCGSIWWLVADVNFYREIILKYAVSELPNEHCFF